MNRKINALLESLNSASTEYQRGRQTIEAELQAECNKVFENDKALQTALSNLEMASEYSADRHGEIVRWYRYAGLSDVLPELRDYLDNYVSDHCVSIDWDNECLQMNEGDVIIIQDDTRHDNGVWLSGKLIIDESEYKDDGEVDELKRNQMIEAYMERTGYFPGVFRVDSYGNVSHVNTQTKKGKVS